MQNRFIKFGIALAITIAVAFLFYKRVYIPKSTYEYKSPKVGDLNLTVFGIGELSAKNIYKISSNSGGKILKIFKDEGQSVKKGEVVALLDEVDLPKQLEEAKALRKKAILETQALKEELQGLKAQYILINKSFKRYEALYKDGYASESEYDKAKADLDSIKSQIEALKSRINSSLFEQKRAKSAIEAIQERLKRLKVTSLVDGYIISKDVSKSQTILPQQSIISVVKPKEVWIRAYIDESLSGKIKINQEAKIRLRSKRNRELNGFVARIEAKSDAITQERVVDIAFREPLKRFYINEQAEVTIKVGELKGVLIIPLSLIQDGGVWVYKDGKAHFIKLKILGKNGNFVAVEGLKKEDKILVPNPHKKPLFEGATIRI